MEAERGEGWRGRGKGEKRGGELPSLGPSTQGSRALPDTHPAGRRGGRKGEKQEEEWGRMEFRV